MIEMHEWDIWTMSDWRRKLFGIKYEDFDSHINTLEIRFDKIPNPTKKEREVAQVPVKARRYIATNWLGKAILRSLFEHTHQVQGLTQNGTCLEVFPIRRVSNDQP